jgi:hypothetical protein
VPQRAEVDLGPGAAGIRITMFHQSASTRRLSRSRLA